MFIQPSFGAKYHKIQCVDTEQAKKLIVEMQAAMKNATIVKGSGKRDVIISSMRNPKETAEALRCMKNVCDKKPINTAYAAELYKRIYKGEPETKVNVLL